MRCVLDCVSGVSLNLESPFEYNDVQLSSLEKQAQCLKYPSSNVCAFKYLEQTPPATL